MDHIVGFDSVKRTFKKLSIDMKNSILCTFLFLSVLFSWGQENPRVVIPSGNAKESKPPSQPHAVLPNKGFSPQSAFLLMELDKLKKENRAIQPADSALIERYNLFYIGRELFVNSFLIINEEFDKAKFESKGGFVNSTSKSIATASIPVNKLNETIEIEGIIYIQIAERAERKMDIARSVTRVDWVHQDFQLPQAYLGTGVVVGIIDEGFDYTHTNFFDDSGLNNYRVKRVWEQGATTGTPPSGFFYGRELTSQAAILNAQRDQINKSHGTHVAGIAAGAGGGLDPTYRGVAPESELVFVSTLMTTVSVAHGIQYIINYANSVNKPCVINMSIGGHIGPHDGTSCFDQFCDGIVGNGKVLVGAAGNSGERPIYLGKTYTSSDNVLYSFVQFPYSVNGTNGETVIDVWGNPNQDYQVRVNIYNTIANTFEDYTPYIQASSNSTSNYTLYDDDYFSDPDPCNVSISARLDSCNNKRNVQIQIDHTAQDDGFRWAMVEIIATTGQTKMWAAYGGAQFTNLGYSYPAVSGSTNSTVAEIGGTGNSIISVGAYNTNITQVGNVAPFSSKGPTADNRTKPDITAPGNRISASVSRFDNNYLIGGDRWSDVVSGVTNGINDWYFAQMKGTSMASPIVAGVIALWLQAYPNLNQSQALNFIKQNALTDAFTGIIPSVGSNTWGWGKVNAHQGLLNLLASLPSVPTITHVGDLSPCQGQVVQLNAPPNYPYYQWSNGETSQSISVTNSGDYFVRVANNEGYISPWSSPINVTFNPIPSIPLITENGINLVSSSNSGNQWYLNNTAIAGATGQTYSPGASGTYYVQVTNSNGCSENSAPFNFIYTPAPVAQFQANLNQVCAGECIVFTDNSSNQPTNWSWVFQGGTPSSSSSQTPSSICYQIPGTYFVSLTVSNAGGSDVQTSSGYITVTATPSIPTISGNGNQLSSSASQGNQWYLNNTPISGATGQTYSPTASGTYYVQVTNSNGCSEMSQPFGFVYTNAPFAAFSTQNNDQALCVGDCINFLDQSANSPTSWQWSFPGGTPSSSTAQNPPFICYNNSGVYLVALTVSNAGGSDIITTNAYITVVNDPQTPIISVDGNVLTSSSNSGNQWYLNGLAITGAIGQTHLATQSGNYSVTVSNVNGCSSTSTVLNLTVTDIDEVNGEMESLLYPNPSSGIVMVQSAYRFHLIEVFDLSGKLLLSTIEQQFDLSPFAEGIYAVRLHGVSAVINQKLIKTNK